MKQGGNKKIPLSHILQLLHITQAIMGRNMSFQILERYEDFGQLIQCPGGETTPMHQRPLSDGTSCVICSNATMNARFLPCGHDNFCLECARKIIDGGAIQEDGPQEPRCPLCRGFAFVVQPYTRPRHEDMD